MQLSKKQYNTLSKGEKKALLKVELLSKQSPRNGGGKRKPQGKRVKPGAQPTLGKQVPVAAAYSTGLSTRAPIITMTRDQCRIRHRELISSVTGSAAFTVANSFSVNPGLSATFPWLSVMAQAWEQYEFNDLKFCYYTRTGTNVPGSLMMAFDYDAADAPPSTEQIASSYEGVVEDAPWKDICCFVRKLSMAGMVKRRYTRNGPLSANLDVKTYDVGQLHLITLDGTAVPWGKLWVEYDVTFYLPQLPPTGSVIYGGSVSGGGTMSGANPLGTLPTLDPQANGLTVNDTSVVTLPNAGDYLVTFQLTGTTLTAVTCTPGGGAILVSSSTVINSAATSSNSIFVVRTVNGSGTVDFTATAVSVTASVVNIAQGPQFSFN